MLPFILRTSWGRLAVKYTCLLGIYVVTMQKMHVHRCYRLFHFYVHMFFGLVNYLVTSFLYHIGKITLQGPSPTVCFGEVYVLSCSHPQLEGSDYLPAVFWKMNGVDLHPDGKDIISQYISGTLTNLQISIVNNQFRTENVSFACYLYNSAMSQQDISNSFAFKIISK